MLTCENSKKMIHENQSNKLLLEHLQRCDSCRLVYLQSSVNPINLPAQLNKFDIIQAAQIKATQIIKRKMMIQNILFISFAFLWLSSLGTLMIKYNNLTILYFSISYLVLPFIIIHSKRKEIFQ